MPLQNGSPVSQNSDEYSVHYLYLLKHGPNNCPERTSDSNPIWYSTFGYYDELYEQIATVKDTSYKESFALCLPPSLNHKDSTAKQVITLFPLQGKDVYPSATAKQLNTPICPNPSDSGFPPFLGVLFFSFNISENNQRETLEQRQFEFSRQFSKICEEQRSNPDCDQNDKFSADAFIRWYACANCADLCVTVNTYCLQDVFLASKAVQLAAHTAVTPQFSPLWSFAAIATDNNYLKEHFDTLIKRNQDITVDFRLSIQTLKAEREFLNSVPDYPDPEGPCSVERVGGVLGTGSYSVHLEFVYYLCILLGFSVDDVLMAVRCDELPKLVRFFCSADEKNHLLISNQRIRFCYQKDVLNTIAANESDFSLQRSIPNVVTAVEQRLEDLESFSYILPSHGYSFRECLDLIKDLLYSYTDLLKGKSIHSFIFTSQLMALVSGIQAYRQYIEQISSNSVRSRSEAVVAQKKRSDIDRYIVAMVEDTNRAVTAIEEYNRGLVLFTRNAANNPIYGIQTRVNIEKYLIAYSMFLQYICDRFNGCKNSDADPVSVYPFCYLDLHLERTEVLTLFHWPHKNGMHLTLLPVACPNYRLFADGYHFLPLLTHEISHQFRYISRKERNDFVLEQAMEYLANQIADALLNELLPTQDFSPLLRQALANPIAQVLKERLGDKTAIPEYCSLIETTPFRHLGEVVLRPLCMELTCAFEVADRFYSVLNADELCDSLSLLMRAAHVPLLSLDKAQNIVEKHINTDSPGQARECDVAVLPLLCISAMYWFFSRRGGKNEDCVKWSIILSKVRTWNPDKASDWSKISDGLKAIIENETVQGTPFTIKYFRDLGNYLLMLALTHELDGEARIFKEIWRAKDFLKYISCQKRKKAGLLKNDVDDPPLPDELNDRTRNFLLNFWTAYHEIMHCESSEAIIGNVTQMWNYVLQELPDSKTSNIDCSCLLQPSLNGVYYTKQAAEAFLANVQSHIDAFMRFLLALKEQPFAAIGNLGQNDLQANLCDAIMNECRNQLRRSRLHSVTNQKVFMAFSDEITITKTLGCALKKKKSGEWAEKASHRLDLYSEICADFGMCSVYRFTPLEYLLFSANHAIQELDNSPTYRFRDQRFQVVVDQLLCELSETDPVSHAKLHEEVKSFYDKALTSLRNWLHDTPINSVVGDGSGSPATKIFGHLEQICQQAAKPVDCTNDKWMRVIHQRVANLETILNDARETLRTELAKQNSLEQNRYNEQLLTLQVIRYITNVFCNCSLGQEKPTLTEYEKAHYKKLLERMKPWVRGIEEDSCCFIAEVKAYYSTWASTGSIPKKNLKGQLDFLQTFYSYAYERYEGIRMALISSDLKDSIAPEVWFDRYFGAEMSAKQEVINDGEVS